MTFGSLTRASLTHYRRTHLAVVFGVAAAVAVLAGSLLVGSSVRASLSSLVTARLGQADLVVTAENPFTEDLADRLREQPELQQAGARVAPVFALEGITTHQASGRRAGNVSVYGVDARFFEFHGVTVEAPTGGNVWLSPDLAVELGAVESDAIVLRVARPTDIPLDSLHGRKDDTGRAIRLTTLGALSREQMGEFSLSPSQGPVRAVFMALPRIQRDLDQTDRVNALLVGRGSATLPADAVVSALDAAISSDDLGLRIESVNDMLLVETTSGLLGDALATTMAGIATRTGLERTDVLTWMANTMTAGERTVPYSLVAGLGPSAGGDARLAELLTDTGEGAPPIVLNDWAARDLGVEVGSSITMSYYRWADEGRLVTEQTPFRVAGIVPIEGIAADRRLSPEYPGITDADSVGDWDPPFPIDLQLVRPVDEDYWDKYRTTAKAFVPLEVAQELWRTRYGGLSSMRLRGTGDPADIEASVARALGSVRGGLTVVDVREQNLSASAGATDFGAYFSYFSFFLVVSALLLTALFFRLGIEQRLREIGLLRATGFSVKAIQRLFLQEGLVVAVIGAVAGIVLAIGWAALMMYGLRTWWVGAVGTTSLVLHVDPVTLLIGGVGGVVAALLCIWLTVRAVRRYSPRELLSGTTTSNLTAAQRPSAIRRMTPVIVLVLAVLLTAATFAGLVPAAAGFFGAGALVLIGGLMALGAHLRKPQTGVLGGSGMWALAGFGWRNASWRPGRSMTSAALVAVAAFLLVSVDSFRKDTHDAADPRGGTGGFALMAESVLPFVHDPSNSSGRQELGLQFQANDPLFAGATIFGARLRPGDDASCLNLYQPKQPRVLGVSDELIDAGRFTFAKSLATTDEDRANPWRLLRGDLADGIVPAIVDATSLQYVLHSAVGEIVTIDADTARPLQLRIVGSLSDSVLQGEIMIAESAFAQVFPDQAGYRVMLVEAPTAEAEQVATAIEERLEPYGADAQSTMARLEAYHRVENTYLSTFQTLGGLGLVLGTIGLAAVTARNVLERRRELALLSAAGYRMRDLSTMVVAENLGLVAIGLGVGVVAALISIAPVLIARGGRLPALSMVWLLAVALAGVVAALVATRAVKRLPLLASLRSE
ncbi:MAG: ABC transporter permease [Acidobacteria bacterium]|nr:ABC transporter permease [Acidobacteriota bacterium]